MKFGVLFSGGKDSCLALLKAMGRGEVKCLISIFSSNPESYMFHVPNIYLTELQSKSMGIPLLKRDTKGIKEKELIDLESAIKEAIEKYGIDTLVTGAIKSNYQKKRIEDICRKLEIECFNPLWHKDEIGILKEVVEQEFEVIISGVFAYPLDESWLGKRIDEQTIEKLKEFMEKFKISPVGEGGEIETNVLDTPFFKQKIKIIEWEKKWEGNSGVFLIKKAKLVQK